MSTSDGLNEVLFAVRPVPAIPEAYAAELPAVQELSVSVTTNVRALESLRPMWSQWATGLETDFDFFVQTLKKDPTVQSPYVIAIHENAMVRAILIGRVRKHRPSTVVSFINMRAPNARVLEILAGGRLGPESEKIDRMLARQVVEATRTADIDLVCFQRLPLHSSLFRALKNSQGLLFKERVPHVFTYSVMSLAAPPGKRPRALSGKNRREVRRKTRILERAFQDGMSFRCFSDSSELEQGLTEAANVAVTSWQSYSVSRTVSVPDALRNFKVLPGVGKLRIYLMYVENRPVAFLIGQQYGQSFYCREAGYNFDFTKYSVGSVLTAWAFEDLVKVGVEQVDLGEGGQEHSRRLGCKVSEEGTVHIYAPSLRGFYMNLFFGTTMAMRAVGRHAREELGLEKLGRAWSNLMIRRSKSRLHSDKNE